MEINQDGLNLILSFEKCKLVVYKDQAGYRTVGVGHRTTLPVGATITSAEAQNLLKGDLERFERCVNNGVKVDVTSNQFSALVAFSYNVGDGAFLGSRLLKILNSGDTDGAAEQFARWDRAGGKVSLGLSRRRAAELRLFRS